ncbi:MAG: alpha/beta hydrolase [Actinomycetota bacterium]|nr:alpha/beta hydrolase [Actinomycetota bacterium]
MSVLRRNAVIVEGPADAQPILFAHGFGCDQAMWRHVAPAFVGQHRVVLFDHVGHGSSDLSAWRPDRYASLEDYAEDVLEICAELDLDRVVYVGHSVAAMIGVLAVRKDPSRFASLVLVSPSPSYMDDGDYRGGFSRSDIDGLLEALDANHLGWSQMLAPMMVGNPDRPELGAELTSSFCRTDPEIAKHFARVTFLSDNRADLPQVGVPSLVLQCREDAIAPPSVGAWVAQQIPDSRLVLLEATGHCPNLSAPDETAAAIRAFL